MMIETDGWGLPVTGFFRSFLHGLPAGFGCGDGSDYTKDSQYHHNPHSQREFSPEPYSQKQKKQRRKNDGKTKLPYPHKQT
jgi:hypothetical protein